MLGYDRRTGRTTAPDQQDGVLPDARRADPLTKGIMTEDFTTLIVRIAEAPGVEAVWTLATGYFRAAGFSRVNYGYTRFLHGNGIGNPADADLGRARSLAKAVQRDMHKMKAFVRFRRVVGEQGERFVAWFEPEHHILDEHEIVDGIDELEHAIRAVMRGVPAVEYQRRNCPKSRPLASSIARTKSSQVAAVPSCRSKYRSQPLRKSTGPKIIWSIRIISAPLL